MKKFSFFEKSLQICSQLETNVYYAALSLCDFSFSSTCDAQILIFRRKLKIQIDKENFVFFIWTAGIVMQHLTWNKGINCSSTASLPWSILVQTEDFRFGFKATLLAIIILRAENQFLTCHVYPFRVTWNYYLFVYDNERLAIKPGKEQGFYLVRKNAKEVLFLNDLKPQICKTKVFIKLHSDDCVISLKIAVTEFQRYSDPISCLKIISPIITWNL